MGGAEWEIIKVLYRKYLKLFKYRDNFILVQVAKGSLRLPGRFGSRPWHTNTYGLSVAHSKNWLNYFGERVFYTMH